MEGGDEIFCRLNPFGMKTIGAGDCGEVRVDHGGAKHAGGELMLLMGADGAVDAVVKNQDDRGSTMLHGRGEFLTVHLEVAVTGKAQGHSFRRGDLGCDGCGDAVTHRPGLWGQQPRLRAIAQVAAGPSGEVAGPVGHDHILGQVGIQISHHQRHIDRGRLRRGDESRFVTGAGLGAPSGPISRNWLYHGGKHVRAGLDRERSDVDFADFVRGGVDVDQFLHRVGNRQQAVGSGRHFIHAQVQGEDDIR